MRQNFSEGQEIIYQDLNTLQGRMQRGIFDQILYELLGRKTNAFFQDGLKVSKVSDIEFSVNAGVGFHENDEGLGEPVKRPIILTQTKVFEILPASDRTDIVCVKAHLVAGEAEVRRYKEEFVDTIFTAEFVISKEWDADILYLNDTVIVPAGYVKLAEINVAAGVGIVDVVDFRSLLPIATGISKSGQAGYDFVVGNIGSDQGATHQDLKSALEEAQDGSRILVLIDQIINDVPEVTKDEVEIIFKRGVNIEKGTGEAGLIISGNDCKIINGKFIGFNGPSDCGIIVSGNQNILNTPRFFNCTEKIQDNGLDTYVDIVF
jgi:hypothetical protein